MGNYYNEYDPKAAAWLRELIKRGLIADGEVDERSILDVQPDDLRAFTQCHFFAGIGGWSYALRLAGWPDDQPVWTGSPPCQPFSAAGQQKGQDDERHLAPHFAALIAAVRPPILFGEQVASSAVFGRPAKRPQHAAGGQPEWAWLDDLFGRLEAAHYACGASDIPAAGVGAPHIRQRTFFGAVRLADAESRGRGEFGNETQSRRGGYADGGEFAVSLADADGGRCNQSLQPLPDGISERPWGDCQLEQLADPSVAGPQGRLSRWAGEGREDQPRHAGCGGPALGLADADGGRCRGLGQDNDSLAEVAVGGRSRSIPHLTGRGEVGELERDSWPRPSHGGWSDADWLFCRDGKWRPVEPGTCPLAHGLPARVVRLRGYGNAIVPQAAARFVECFSASVKAISHACQATDMVADI